MKPPNHSRAHSVVLSRRLRETRRFIQAVVGPRQVGKTTLVQQVIEADHFSARFASADEPTLRGTDWIEQQWEGARLLIEDAGKRSAVLVLDEIQKIPNWSETVKRLWDEDTRTHSIESGSARIGAAIDFAWIDRKLGGTTQHVPTLLPRTNLIALNLQITDGKYRTALCPWSEVERIVGRLMTTTAEDPERVRVNAFPDEQKWTQLVAVAEAVK
jgi:AAA domain